MPNDVNTPDDVNIQENASVLNGANNEIVNVNIADIKVTDRIRGEVKDEDLEPLMESIKADGLLQPIVINQDNKLIAGFRRYTCCKLLGHDTILAQKVHTTDELHEIALELRENIIREDFTFSERMKAADKIELIVAETGKKRMAGEKTSSLAVYGLSPNESQGKTRDIMAKILGLGSGKTYEQARSVWKAENNKNYISKLDANKISINRASILTKEATQAKKSVKPEETKAKKKGNFKEISKIIDIIKISVENDEYAQNELVDIFNEMSSLKAHVERLITAVEKSPQV